MTSTRCIDTPISWLRLERHALGETSESEAREIEAHLAGCAVCRACAESTRAPVALPALPALPVRATASALPAPRVLPRPKKSPRRLVIAASAFALAALTLLVLRAPDDHVLPSERVATRGGDVAIVVVREREGAIVENPGAFEEGDRFRVAVTCDAPETRVRVFVVQGPETSLALESPHLRCGNRVVLEGAFRITGGGEAEVCAVFGEIPDTVADAELGAWLGADPSRVACRTMQGP